MHRLPRAPLICLLLASCAQAASADPRIPLVELQISRNHEEALRLIDQLLAENPEQARELGLQYLRGHLLQLLERRQEALEAFAATMSATPELGPYSRYRLALEQERSGHPEVAAGLVATLLRSGPPRSLVAPAMKLLDRTVSEGGDCRVLRGLEPYRFRTADRRELMLALAECQARGGDLLEAAQTWIRLLEDDCGDSVARIAAEKLDALETEKKSARAHMLIGLSFYRHREFDLAVHHLARALVQQPSGDVSPRELYELRYALARSHFWEERYGDAATAFGDLAGDTRDPQRKARSLYQQARCYELSGSWDAATAHFRLAVQAEPGGGSADSALIADLRLQWRRGDEGAALAALDQLLAKRQYSTAARGLLFLASSDLVAKRGDRAGEWLGKTAELKAVAPRELHYWQGRLAEIRHQPQEAVEHYLVTLREDPYDPFAQAARRRLRGPDLVAVARAAAERLAASSLGEDLYGAWLLLPPSHPLRPRVRQKLERQLLGDQKMTAFLHLEVEPVADWPLWKANLERPEEMLLALGLFHEGGSMVLRHFPVARPDLAYTGSVVLSQTGDTRRSLYIAEILDKRVPAALPEPLLPQAFRQLLHPATYLHLIRREAERRRIDPHLLLAIIREESRFDPNAFSAASARGLTQFLFPTAREISQRYELGPVTPGDLERPETAIALGAAYLRDLYEEFDGSEPEVVAAYNAGEPQAALWRRYCVSGEAEEYLTKVAFRETRNYVARVLTSRAHYAELYPLSPVRVLDDD